MKTYYIDPIAGVDTNSGRSFTSAFKTWRKLNTVIAEGDRVKLGGGTYNEKLVVRTNSITIDTYGNGDAVFSGSNILSNKINKGIVLPNKEVTTGYAAGALCTIDANFVTINNVIIDSSEGRGLEASSSNRLNLNNITIRNSKAHGMVISNCEKVSLFNVQVDDSSSYAKSWRDSNLAKFMSGIYAYNSSLLTFINVTISNTYGVGLEFNNVTTAELYKLTATDNYTGVSLYNCENVIFDQTFMYQINPLFTNKGNGGFHVSNNNYQISLFNSIIANHTININIEQPTEEMTFNNCTIYNVNKGQVLLRVAKAQTAFSIQNTIFYGEDAILDLAVDYLATAADFDSNLWFGVIPPTELESVNDVTSDPEFATKTIISDLNNYKLLTTSPAINAANGNAQFGDYLSNTPIGTRDLGAIEFIVGTTEIIDPVTNNVLLNSTFDTTDTDWTLTVDASEIINGKLHVSSESLGIISQSAIEVVAGQYYEVSIETNGSPGSSPVTLQLVTSTNVNLGLNHVVGISEDSTTYKVIFQAGDSETDATLVLSFSGEYYFDNIYLYEIEPKIIADFNISNINPSLGQLVYFVNESVTTSPITAVEWTFDGFGSANTIDAYAAFILPGAASITLSITTIDGTDSITKEIHVKGVLDPQIDVSHTIAKVGELISFSNISSILIPIDSYLWDFGDGSKAVIDLPVHSYSQPGTYTVTLTTTNEGGSATSEEKIIEIVDYDFLPNTTVALELMAVDPTTGFFIRIPPPPNINYTLVSIENGNLAWMPYRG